MIRRGMEFGNSSSGEKIIRVRGAALEGSVEIKNLRLKWDGSDYAETTEEIAVYDPVSNAAYDLVEDEETFVIWRPASRRWELIGGEMNLVYGLSTSSTTAGTSTFQIDNIVAKRGPAPSSPLTVNNTLALALSDNHPVYAFKNRIGGWDTWANTDGGGGGGSTVDIIHFELEEDLALAATSADATVLSSTDSTTGTVSVTDEEAKFSALTGYRGYAYHDGVAFRILYMEGPARFGDFIATAASSETSETITATLEDLWGNPPNGVAPASLTGITVYKLPIDADATARYVPLKNGDKFRAIWDEVEEKWKLFWYPGLRIVVRAPYSSPIDEGTTSITLAVGSGETAMQLVSGFVLPADDITVTCDPDMYRSGGTSEYGGYIYAAYNHQLSSDPNACWDAGDARNFLWHLQGIGSYDPAESMIILQDSNDDPEWTIAKEIDVITEITSLAVTGGNLVLTYKKGTFLVVKEISAPASDTVTVAVTECE